MNRNLKWSFTKKKVNFSELILHSNCLVNWFLCFLPWFENMQFMFENSVYLLNNWSKEKRLDFVVVLYFLFDTVTSALENINYSLHMCKRELNIDRIKSDGNVKRWWKEPGKRIDWTKGMKYHFVNIGNVHKLILLTTT